MFAPIAKRSTCIHGQDILAKNPRITSYNVCYTKLLRGKGVISLKLTEKGGKVAGLMLVRDEDA